MSEKTAILKNVVLIFALLFIIPTVQATTNIGAATGVNVTAEGNDNYCFKIGYSNDMWCPTRATPIKKLSMQQGRNFCGQAVMQAFIPEVSQYKLREELNKEIFMRTYWSDFNAIFDTYGIAYHWDTVSEENTPVIVGGYVQQHVILVLEKTNSTHYTAFDPARGLIYPPAERIERWDGLVIESA